jgi:CRISPR-associated endonuclease/helicase Cas3
MLTPDDFPAFFEAVNGVSPFPWQVRLLHHLAEAGCWPAVLDLPTGSGKTAALDIAVFHLALEADRQRERRAPIRIAFVVDRRLIVDDAFARARALADRLANPQEPVVKKVKAALCYLAEGEQPPLLARRLRGGAPREDDWARTPVQPTILCSTVDQVGSRLLFRGYGISDRMKPIHAGLLGSDCLILLDEAHLAEPFRQTLGGIKRLRGADATNAPWQFALLSATPGGKPDGSDKAAECTFRLGDDDRADPTLAKRLAVTKPATLVEVAGRQGVPAERRRIEALVAQTKATLEKLRPEVENPAIAVVVNRVARARQAFADLAACKSELGDADLALIIGPARPVEREKQATSELQPIRTGAPRGLPRPQIIVATQTIEAGVDIDFDGLVTEAAPLDALRQRFGRLNRAGRAMRPIAAILGHRDDVGARADDPVYGDRIKKTWEALNSVAAGNGERVVEFGIDRFPRELDAKAASLAAEKADAPVLMPAYADLWSQTSPIPNADPDVSLFLHGPDRSPASVQIVWRADIADGDLVDRNRDRLVALLDLVPPRSREAIDLPLWAARAWLRHQSAPLSDLSDIAERVAEEDTGGRGRPAFRYAGADDRQRTGTVFAHDLRPGDLIVVPASYGGCDKWGWDPDAIRSVTDLAEKAAKPYAARRFAVRVTPELILQGRSEEARESEGGLSLSLGAVRDDLAALLAEHRDDKARDLLDAVLGLPALPGRLREWIERIKNDCRGRPEVEFPYNDDAQERPRGVVFVARRGVINSRFAEDLSAVPATEDDDLGSAAGKPQLLDEHSKQVRKRARQFADRAGLPPKIAEDVALAGYLHDAGKLDPRFQAYLAGGDPSGHDPKNVLAKSGRSSLRGARERAGLPENWRHEALSVRLAQLHPDFAAANDPVLVLWLVGVHHGLGRPLFPHFDPKDAESRADLPAALGVAWELEPGHGPQSLAFDFGGRDWAQLFAELKDRYGIWGLARLEAMLRLADHRASEEATELGQPLTPRVPSGRVDTADRPVSRYRLEGLEPDNLLAFLALLGLLRTLEAARPSWHPRAGWDLENPPLRPLLFVDGRPDRIGVVKAAADGAAALSAVYEFAPESPAQAFQRDLNYSRCRARRILQDALLGEDRDRAALWAALMSDAAVRDERIEATPLCLLFGQGHQHFLERLADIPRWTAPLSRGRGKQRVTLSAAEALDEALFQPWTRQDPTPGFRWDPAEDIRYALRADDPSDSKSTTQHGANRLAVFGLPALTAVPVQQGSRVRLEVLGSAHSNRGFAFSWPIWRVPASFAAVRALLSHPDLHKDAQPLSHLGVAQVRISHRIGVGKFMNFTAG